MKADLLSAQRSSRIWLTPEACDIEEFIALVDRRADPADYPLAATIAVQRADLPGRGDPRGRRA